MLRLMPLVNFFKKKVIKLGQCVLRQGDYMREVFVVAKGRCKVVDISIRSRSKIKSFKIRGLRSKLRNLRHGPQLLDTLADESKTKVQKVNLKFVQMKQKQEEKRIRDKRKEERRLDEMRRNGEVTDEDSHREFSFQEEPDLMKLDEERIYYRDHAFVKYLERGSVFGLRSLKKYTLEETDEGWKPNSSYSQHANLSVLAETARVVVYSFDRDNFKFLTEEIQVVRKIF